MTKLYQCYDKEDASILEYILNSEAMIKEQIKNGRFTEQKMKDLCKQLLCCYINRNKSITKMQVVNFANRIAQYINYYKRYELNEHFAIVIEYLTHKMNGYADPKVHLFHLVNNCKQGELSFYTLTLDAMLDDEHMNIEIFISFIIAGFTEEELKIFQDKVYAYCTKRYEENVICNKHTQEFDCNFILNELNLPAEKLTPVIHAHIDIFAVQKIRDIYEDIIAQRSVENNMKNVKVANHGLFLKHGNNKEENINIDNKRITESVLKL